MKLARIPWAALMGLILVAVLAANLRPALADEAPVAAAAPAVDAPPTVEQRLANLEAYVTNGAPDTKGGALGNVWDRLTIGHVVDFILVHYRGWTFPAFNVADSAITVGAVALILDGFRQRHAASRADSPSHG